MRLEKVKNENPYNQYVWEIAFLNFCIFGLFLPIFAYFRGVGGMIGCTWGMNIRKGITFFDLTV